MEGPRAHPRIPPVGRTLLVLLLLIASAAIARGADSGIDCERCHGNRPFLVGKRDTPERDEALFVPAASLEGTAHQSLQCADCHRDYGESFPHPPSRETVACLTCHATEHEDWVASIHAANVATRGDAPDCIACHGIHDVRGPEDRLSPVHPLNEAKLCAQCHADPAIIAEYFADPADSVAATAVLKYHETVHGLALEKAGLVVSATCSDCHSPHRILPSDRPESSVNPDHIPATCGTCHVGVLEDWEKSSHGRAWAAGTTNESGQGAPTCTGCHDSHGVAPVEESWKADVVDECATCHQHLYETYLETYHGKVTKLGGLAAKCSDCHTPHGNLPADDPASTVHVDNRVETCRQCHAKANASFATFVPHADPEDSTGNPALFWTYTAMTLLLVGTLTFFGLHTVLWLGRETVDAARRTRRVREGNADKDADKHADAADPAGEPTDEDATTEPDEDGGERP
jgi:nitrate/TMAO reductase-like tetraheme cytochrome c subunit